MIYSFLKFTFMLAESIQDFPQGLLYQNLIIIIIIIIIWCCDRSCFLSLKVLFKQESQRTKTREKVALKPNQTKTKKESNKLEQKEREAKQEKETNFEDIK